MMPEESDVGFYWNIVDHPGWVTNEEILLIGMRWFESRRREYEQRMGHTQERTI